MNNKKEVCWLENSSNLLRVSAALREISADGDSSLTQSRGDAEKTDGKK